MSLTVQLPNFVLKIYDFWEYVQLSFFFHLNDLNVINSVSFGVGQQENNSNPSFV